MHDGYLNGLLRYWMVERRGLCRIDWTLHGGLVGEVMLAVLVAVIAVAAADVLLLMIVVVEMISL